MKVTLREKKLTKGKKSLYLDYYPAIIHPVTGKESRREFLNLYLTPRPKNDIERQLNQENKLRAEHIRADRQLMVGRGDFSFIPGFEIPSESIFPLIKELQKEAKSKTALRQYTKLEEYLKEYAGKEDILFSDLTPDFCNGYINSIKEKFASQNHQAFNSSPFKKLLNRAVMRDKIIATVATKTKGIPFDGKNTTRNFLLEHELIKLKETPVKPFHERCRDVCLFSALTGLRRVDILSLKWSNVMKEGDDFYIHFSQVKTSGREYQPLNKSAVKLMGERGTGKVFKDVSVDRIDLLLEYWIEDAGIERHITFHCFRHTFATLMLTKGVSLQIVSKLLGHTDVSTTMIYSHIINSDKRGAVDKLDI